MSSQLRAPEANSRPLCDATHRFRSDDRHPRTGRTARRVRPATTIPVTGGCPVPGSPPVFRSDGEGYPAHNYYNVLAFRRYTIISVIFIRPRSHVEVRPCCRLALDGSAGGTVRQYAVYSGRAERSAPASSTGDPSHARFVTVESPRDLRTIAGRHRSYRRPPSPIPLRAAPSFPSPGGGVGESEVGRRSSSS